MKVYEPKSQNEDYTKKQLNALNVYTVFVIFTLLSINAILMFIAFAIARYTGVNIVQLFIFEILWVVCIPFGFVMIASASASS